MNGYDYGNARVRYRKSQLLDRTDYERLLRATSIVGLLGELGTTPYGADLEAVPPRRRAEDRLDETVRRHLVRHAVEVRSFYEEDARRQIDLALERWDLRNLQAILRGAAAPAPPDAGPLLVPAGTIPAAELAELAAQRSLRAVIDLMVAWSLPTRRAARSVLAAWPRYEPRGDLTVIEEALHLAYAERFAEALVGLEGEPVAEVIGAEIDRVNLLVALRRRQARVDEDVTPAGEPLHLPGGRVSALSLAGAVGSDDPAAAAASVTAAVSPSWQPAIASWVAHGNLARLADDLDEAILRHTISLFVTGDPLGAAVPLAFLAALEGEGRNLRLIGRGITHRIAVGLVEARLVAPW